MYPPDDRVLACLWPPGLDVPGCGFELYWYGVIIVAGMLIGAYLGSREAARRGIDPDHVWGGLTWALIFGIIGARLYHVLTPPPSMGITPFDYLTFRDLNASGWPDIIELRLGGLGIVGAIIGGLAGVAIYCRRNKLSFLTAADLAGYSMPIGQAIGRWANFFNQELYGGPTTLPWGLRIDMVNRVPPYNDLALYPDTTRFHPAFLYESLWNLLAFGVIVYAARRYGERLLRGELFALYAVLYAIGRILTETVRADSPTFPLGGLDVNYASAVSALAIVGIAVAVVLRRRAAAAGAFGSEEWEESEIDEAEVDEPGVDEFEVDEAEVDEAEVDEANEDEGEFEDEADEELGDEDLIALRDEELAALADTDGRAEGKDEGEETGPPAG